MYKVICHTFFKCITFEFQKITKNNTKQEFTQNRFQIQ